MRTGNLEIRELTPLAMDMLKDDFDFYCISFPLQLDLLVHWDEAKKPKRCTLINDNLTVTKTAGAAGWDCGVIANTAVDRYTLRVDNKGASGSNCMIGFTAGTTWNINGQNFDCNGWFMHIFDGTLYAAGVANAPYSTAINTGDYITVIREGTTIRYEKNKVSLGVCTAFTGIPDQPLFPTVNIYANGCSITLVNDY